VRACDYACARVLCVRVCGLLCTAAFLARGVCACATVGRWVGVRVGMEGRVRVWEWAGVGWLWA
jgi:hypothetical protein